jgi:predicted DNA-binding protein YlxM (UPF0122 family)
MGKKKKKNRGSDEFLNICCRVANSAYLDVRVQGREATKASALKDFLARPETTGLIQFARKRVMNYGERVDGYLLRDLFEDTDIKSAVLLFLWEFITKKRDVLMGFKKDEEVLKYLFTSIKQATQREGAIMDKLVTGSGLRRDANGKIVEISSGTAEEVMRTAVSGTGHKEVVDDEGSEGYTYYKYWGDEDGTDTNDAWDAIAADEQVNILVLRFKDDKTIAQIAEEMQVTDRTVINRIQKALEIMRKRALSIPHGIITLEEISKKLIEQPKAQLPAVIPAAEIKE